MLRILSIIFFCISFQFLTAQDDIRFSAQYKSIQGVTDFAIDPIKFDGFSTGVYHARRVHYSGFFTIGLEYGRINYSAKENILAQSGSVNTYALSLGTTRYFLFEDLFMGINFLAEWDSGDTKDLSIATQNGLGVDVSLGYDISVSQEIFLSPIIGIRARSILNFKSREPKSSIREINASVPIDVYFGLKVGYRMH